MQICKILLLQPENEIQSGFVAQDETKAFYVFPSL